MRYIFAVVLIFSSASVRAWDATGNEDRCDELGTACICSEPFNTDSYTDNGIVRSDVHAWNPADTTARQCHRYQSNGAGSAVEARDFSSAIGLRVGSDQSVISRIPQPHAGLGFYLRGATGHVGSFNIGHGLSASDPVKRVAMRMYLFFSDDYQFKGEGSCTNSKFGGLLGFVSDLSNSTGDHHAYNLGNNVLHKDNTTYRYDNGNQIAGTGCCSGGPVGGYDTVKSLQHRPGEIVRTPIGRERDASGKGWKGKWWRVEVVIRNRAGGASPNGTTWEMWTKNVTDNLPETKMVDTTVACPDPICPTCFSTCGGSGNFTFFKDVTPDSPPVDWVWDWNREGTCTGYRAMSHLLVAGWNTDQGQRIGSAAEVEGTAGLIDSGGTPPLRPNPPTLDIIR